MQGEINMVRDKKEKVTITLSKMLLEEIMVNQSNRSERIEFLIRMGLVAEKKLENEDRDHR